MSSLFGTAHHESLVAPEDVGQVLPALAWHLEEPRVGQSYPNYRAAELAARRVKVVLGGTGGDELFGGYPWRYGHLEGATTFDAYLQALYTRWQRLLPAADRADVFAPMHAEIRGLDPFDLLETSFRDAPSLTAKLRPEEIANLSFTFEARTFLHGLLVVDDKLSMAHGLECRVPFLDNDLVDFAMRVPAAMKLRLADNASQGRTNGGKQILRKAMLRFLPAEIVNAQKQGFSAPDETWFRRECRSLIAGRLGDLQSPIYDYLDRPTVARLIDDHVSGRENRRLLIWSLLNFDAFCRAFLHADHSSTFDHPPAQELIHAA